MTIPDLPDPPETALMYFAHGKLLLSGEYAVLDGALALALPARLGQTLRIERDREAGILSWKSLDKDGGVWYEAQFEFPELSPKVSTSEPITAQLIRLLEAAGVRDWDPAFGIRATTQLDFPLHWGLGSSATIVALVAQWTRTDPYFLLENSFGGSGYDLACTTASGPVLYQRRDGQPSAVRVPFAPPFSDQLYFVGLNKKQSSREAIEYYRQHAGAHPSIVDTVSQLTMRFLCVETLEGMEELIWEHERLIASAINMPRARALHFHDYWGEIKSLGAWGGDYVLATSNRPAETTRDYFKQRGFQDFFPYDQLILAPKAEKE